MTQKKGKLIVLYGANNIGKTTQIKLLEKALKGKRIPVTAIKYPIYTLEPTGPLINAILREGKKMNEEEVQKLYAQNRRDFELTLQKMLEDGIYVIAEDYVGTGIAWGMVRGLSLESLEEINKDLYPADISIFLDGQRFKTGREKHNRNETDQKMWETAQAKHELLAKRYGWITIAANQTREKVHEDIMKYIVFS